MKKYVYLIISIVTILRYSTNEVTKCCPNSLHIVFVSSHCKSVLLSPIRGMPSLFSVPFHLVLYQMYFLSLLVPFIYFLCTMSPFSLCSYSFIILFLIFISSFCKIIFPCFHSRSPFHIFCLHISAYHIFGLSRYFHRSCIVILPAILFVLYYSKSGLPYSVTDFVSVLSRIINSAFRLQFLLCLDIIVVLFQLISSLLSFPLFLCRILNLNATHTNFHTF